MQHLRLEDVIPREVQPGHRARFVHGDHMTVAHWRIDAGSKIPEHDHPHEQVVNVISGKYELIGGWEAARARAGDGGGDSGRRASFGTRHHGCILARRVRARCARTIGE